uniref:Predicted protein n=1 Tax=Physcomitrium patens TaxID=3218 RepID=A9U1U0_PHYPA
MNHGSPNVSAAFHSSERMGSLQRPRANGTQREGRDEDLISVRISVRVSDSVTETSEEGAHQVGDAPSANGSANSAACANESWRQIQNLVKISKNEELKTALDDWKEIKNGCETRLKEISSGQADLRNQEYSIIGFFSVFEGVVLTAVSQLTTGTSQRKCGKIWCPIVLTVIAAGLAITALLEKFRRFPDLEYQEADQKFLRKVTAGRISQLRYKGNNFDFAKDATENPSEQYLSSHILYSFATSGFSKVGTEPPGPPQSAAVAGPKLTCRRP